MAELFCKGKFVTLTLDALQANDDIARYSLHPDLDGLKESIAIRGLESPLVVTLNPEADGKYSILNAGNSRLAALIELYKETGDARYFNIECLVYPWPGRLGCVLSCLAESSTQGDRSYLDKALVVYKSKQLYEDELGIKVSLRDLSKYFDLQGILIGKDRISYYLKTIDLIFPAFPTLLEKELSSQECRKLISIYETIHIVWEKIAPQCHVYPISSPSEVFNRVAEHHDAPDLYDREKFIVHLSTELARLIDLSGITPLVWYGFIKEPFLVFYMQPYNPDEDDLHFSNFESDGNISKELIFDEGSLPVNDLEQSPTKCAVKDDRSDFVVIDTINEDDFQTENVSNQKERTMSVGCDEEMQLKTKIYNKTVLIAEKRCSDRGAVKKNNTNKALLGYELINIPVLVKDPFFKVAAAFSGFNISISSLEIVSLLIGTNKEDSLLSDSEFANLIEIIYESRVLRKLQRDKISDKGCEYV